jgi:hypothetical protein
LLARLADPQIARAVSTLLDNADVLAFLAVGLGGFLSRGEVIADSLAGGITELRGAAGAAAAGSLPKVDLPALAAGLSALSGPVVAAAPALGALLSGPLGDPHTVVTLSRLAGAVAEGRDAAEAQPVGPVGALALLRALKDEEVARGLGFLIQVAKALGRQVGAT